MTQDEQKRLAAEAALEALRPALGAGVVLGIGTGSTTNCFIDALAPVKDQFDGAVASSVASARRLEGHGIRVLSLQESGPLALYIDGADEAVGEDGDEFVGVTADSFGGDEGGG